MTYKGIVDRIANAVSKHKMLVDFGYGQLSDIKVLDEEGDGADYPYAFLLPTGISRVGQAVTYSFSLIVMEMAINPREILTVQSNCIQYINDLVADLRFDTDFAGDVNLSQTVQVFRERFQDEVAGATLNLQVTVADVINLCDAPIASPYYVYATELVPQVVGQDPGEDKAFKYQNEIVDVDGTWEINRFTVAKPGTYTIETKYSFQFVKNDPSDIFPEEPKLRYFPVTGGQQYIDATTTTGWPASPVEGTTYNIKQVWSNLTRDTGDFEFVYNEDQPGAEADLHVEANAEIKIYKIV